MSQFTPDFHDLERDMRILFVDDDESVCSLLASFCESLKIDHTTITTAAGALELCAEAEFALCVTDLRMPNMDGVQLARQLRERYPQMGLYAFTGESSVYSLQDLEQTFDKVFFKPSDYSRLLAESMKHLALKKYPFLA